MKVFLTSTFKRVAKKLHRNQKPTLEKAIEEIQNNPLIGELKVGDLTGIRVYKFYIQRQLILLAYTYEEKDDKLILLSFSSHQNFYENLKKQTSNEQNSFV